MRLKEIIVNAILVVLVVVLAVLCVRSVYFTMEAADKEQQMMTHGRE